MKVTFYEQDGKTLIADAKNHHKIEESEFVRVTVCDRVRKQLELSDKATCQKCIKSSCVVNLHR